MGDGQARCDGNHGGLFGGFPTGRATAVFPPYSSDERAAAELVARTTTGRAWSTVDLGVDFNGECEATIGGEKATAPTLALAICRAALLAKMKG